MSAFRLLPSLAVSSTSPAHTELNQLKVHKRENFFGSDFGFLSQLLFPMKKVMFFTKKDF